jgi:omega-hydroxy-beta-dihydromenaquinone-9 sulfotransferase
VENQWCCPQNDTLARDLAESKNMATATTAAKPASASRAEQVANPPREWMPRMWQGCDFFAWMRILIRNRFDVRLPLSTGYIPFVISFVSSCHTLLRYVQNTWVGGRVDRTPVKNAPLFIIGHWRTGTTLLQEMLILDPRHNYPNTYQCLAPNHFLLTETTLTRVFRFLLPSRRPMDNMAAGWDRPQEDEFALCMLGAPSPYLTITFPNHPPQDQDAFDLVNLPARELKVWKTLFLRFIRQLTFKDPRRLILKSPTHTCRIKTLLEMFPDARFVHIVRDPYAVFPSTVNLWKTLYLTHGLQIPTFAGLEEQVFATFTHLYDKLDEGRPLVPAGRFHQMRYEDLIHDPLDEMRKMYDGLELGGFEEVLPRLKAYLDANTDYKTNRYKPLAPELEAEITRRWGKVIRQYGYERG